MNDDNRRIVRNLGEPVPNGFRAGRPTGHARADLAAAEFLSEEDRRLFPAARSGDDDCIDPLRSLQALEAFCEERTLAEPNEGFRPVCAEPLPAAGSSKDGPDAHRALAVALFLGAGFFAEEDFAAAGFFALDFGALFVAVVVFLAAPFEPFAPVRTPSSHSAVASSSKSFAYMSSLARIFLALTNICFSPVERPFSRSRSDRFRTTSASSRMSPVFILSRLCLNRRFQFFGICVPPPVRALTTTLTMSSPITLRRPTFSALSEGTLTVMSLCRILIVRYSRFSPRTSRFSFFTTVPAPWCGYTTLSPTLYKPAPFRPM